MRKDDYIKLWLMDRNAGICIFEQSFEEMPKTLASDLVTGFFYAMLTFSNEIASQDVEYIQMKDIRIVFHGEDRLLFAIAARNDADHAYTERFLKDLERRFKDKYHALLERGFLNNTAVFQGFASEVEAELGKKSTTVSFIQSHVDRFKQKYESFKCDFNQIRQNLTQNVKSITSPLVKIIRDQVDNVKIKHLDTYRPDETPDTKEKDH